MREVIDKRISVEISSKQVNYPFKDEAQTALFKDPVRTAQIALFKDPVRTAQ